MLVLSRKRMESIVIDGSVTVTVLEAKPGKVRLGVQAPAHVTIDREEIHERKQKERRDDGRREY